MTRQTRPYYARLTRGLRAAFRAIGRQAELADRSIRVYTRAAGKDPEATALWTKYRAKTRRRNRRRNR